MAAISASGAPAEPVARDAAVALRAAGASPLQVVVFGVLPRAQSDMTAYAFYRFECALRASAILGFFGFSTLGLYIRQSFNSTNYGEVWTYLYVLIALVVSAEGGVALISIDAREDSPTRFRLFDRARHPEDEEAVRRWLRKNGSLLG